MNPLQFVVLFIAPALVGLPAAQASQCQLSCRMDGCAVTPPTTTALSRTRWLTVDGCDKLQVAQAGVELRYMHRNRWFRAPAPRQGQPLIEIFTRNPADHPCPVLSADCLQTAMMAKHAAAGGHGIDQRDSRPGGEGEPCALGLPCGSLLPRDTESNWRLARPDFKGMLAIRLARGTPAAGHGAELSLPFEQGSAVLGANALQPGGVYTYQLRDAAGKTVASGEFSMLSTAMTQRLHQRVQQRIAQDGLTEPLAWYDVLAENLLVWDALQMQMQER